jgi:hypothetical protein
VRRVRGQSAAIPVAEQEAAEKAPGELTIGLTEGASPSYSSLIVAGTLLFGAGSLLVLVLVALLMLFYSVAHRTARRARPIPGALVRLYWERVSSLVHVPRRRQALRWTLTVFFIFAPAFPRIEVNGWTPETPRVLGNVLRIVSGITFVGDEPPVSEREEDRLAGLRTTGPP